MFDKLSFIEQRYEELAKQISDPDVIADQNLFRSGKESAVRGHTESGKSGINRH